MTAIAVAISNKYGYIATDSRGSEVTGCAIDSKISESRCGRFVVACIGAACVRENASLKWATANDAVLNELEAVRALDSGKLERALRTYCKRINFEVGRQLVAVALDKLERKIVVSAVRSSDQPPYVELRSDIGVSVWGGFQNAIKVDEPFDNEQCAELWCEYRIKMACARNDLFQLPVQMVRLRLAI